MTKHFLVFLFFSYCTQLSATEILPVSAFARLPDVRNLSLSPNGIMVASLVSVETKESTGTAISVINLDTGEQLVPLFTDNEKFVFNWIRWSGNGRLLASARFPANRYGVPSTETRLLKVDLASLQAANVLKNSFIKRQDWLPQFHDDIVDMLPEDEENILLALTVHGPKSSNLYQVSLETGKIKTVARNGGIADDWITDRDHNLRIGISFDETTYKIIHRPIGSKKWLTLWEFEVFADDQVWPLGFDADPNILYVRAYHEDKKAIFKVNLLDEDLARELVFSDSNYDVNGSLIYSKLNKQVIGTTYSSDGGFTFWEDSYIALQKGLNKALPDTNNVLIGFSEDERRYLLLATNDTDPGTYFYGDRDSKALTPIAHKYPALSPELLVEKNFYSYASRDGLDIEAFLTFPADYDGEKLLPSIIFPHGGPISHDDGGFDYWTQFFANRGYAVLQMNFRGSSGYGYQFMKSGLQNWGLEMQNDVEDGTRWLIEQGIADPDRICIVGASYGGYAALMESARNPDLYRCAVSFAGVTDVANLVQSSRRYTNYEVVKEQIGSNMRELRSRSPVNLADQIDIPVLLVHGTKDRSVKVRHSQKMYSALNRRDKQVTYVEQEDGDHHLTNEAHRLELFTHMDEFLRTHLGAEGL